MKIINPKGKVKMQNFEVIRRQLAIDSYSFNDYTMVNIFEKKQICLRYSLIQSEMIIECSNSIAISHNKLCEIK